MNNRLTRLFVLPVFAFLVALGALAVAPASATPLRADHLRCEYKMDPRGIDAVHPRLSWQLSSDTRGERQSAYEVQAATRPEDLAAGRGDLWDSGKVSSAESVGVEYRGRALRSGQKCWWTVRVWDKDGAPAPKSAAYGFWQMGLLKPSDWHAEWIAAPTPRDTLVDGRILPPCPYLRRTFTVGRPIKSAMVFVTARGLYELHLNGAKVGDAVLPPGWTDYRKRLDYQVYDVTAALRPGANTVGAILGDGWYCGYVGFARQRNLYGSVPALRLQLEIEYADGTRQTVVSDSHWRGRTGPILYSDLLQGEAYDARAALPGWDRPGSALGGWLPVVPAPGSRRPTGQVSVTAALRAGMRENTLSVVAGNALAGDPAYNVVKSLRVEYTLSGKAYTRTVPEGRTLTLPGSGDMPGPLVIRRAVYGDLTAPSGPAALVGTVGPPVRVTQLLPARARTQPVPGTYLFDLGQNMVGWARLKVRGPAGTTVKMRFGEVLNPDGTLYTANLRSARATDTYILSGSRAGEVYAPHFTFHGFRYVEVTGYPGPPSLSAVTGCVVGSDTPPAGTFACSSPLVNQLQRNIVWGQRGNFVSVPTDCPQRDERLGWMGDAQIFARTATYNRDTAAFYESWMDAVDDGQSPEGGFSDVSPRLVDLADGAPAWGDAGVIVPWTVWQAYGDAEIVRRHWRAMTRWLSYITVVNPDGLWRSRRGNDFGDWLSIRADTPKDVLATAYYAYDAHLMAQMARAIGRPSEAAHYDVLFAHIKAAFDAAYVSPDGHISGDTQTAYVLALRFGLLPSALRPQAASHLAENIAARENHLSTGFVGVGYLCPVLSETGHNDAAYTLLLNTTFPSWGYSITQGATTIWERWDGYTKDKGFQDPGMNSFNHYSLGSVGQWLFQDVAGIDSDPAQPGCKHLWLHPRPGPGLTSAQAVYAGIRGPIRSAWKIERGRFLWDVSVPANTTATAWVPARSVAAVTESGHPLGRAIGVKVAAPEPGVVVCELASGTYHFAAAVPRPGGAAGVGGSNVTALERTLQPE